jgi:ABC-type multidrug transport system ATPase subunit
MHVKLEDIGKKYGKNWILRHVNLEFLPNRRYAILGNNGSGKSTLLKIISSQTEANTGIISYEGLELDEVHKRISYCAPYIDLIEELSLRELLTFVEKFKPFLPSYPIARIIDIFQFDEDKWLKDYSSGMKQRVKLALALFADVEVCLLDEPTSNLDEKGVQWYLGLLEELKENRTFIVASNDEREYSFCENLIDVNDFKV